MPAVYERENMREENRNAGTLSAALHIARPIRRDDAHESKSLVSGYRFGSGDLEKSPEPLLSQWGFRIGSCHQKSVNPRFFHPHPQICKRPDPSTRLGVFHLFFSSIFLSSAVLLLGADGAEAQWWG